MDDSSDNMSTGGTGDAGDTTDTTDTTDTGDAGVAVDVTDDVSVSTEGEYQEWDAEEVAGSKGVDSMIGNLSGAINGIKGNNELSETEKSETIKANINHTMREIGMSDMKPEEKVSAMKQVYGSVPEGCAKNIYVPADAKFLNESKPFDTEGRARYDWKGDLGFEGETEACTLKSGQVVDRYGDENGAYVCEVKNGVPQDYDSRALPYEENPEMYHQYEIVKDMDDFKSRVENLTVEEIEQRELQSEQSKPESDRRSPEQIREDAEDKYFAIIYDVAKTNGWKDEYDETQLLTDDGKLRDSGLESMKETIKNEDLSSTKGKIAESFSYTDEEGVEHKRGGGEQIYLPASVDTLVYLGYMEEKK